MSFIKKQYLLIVLLLTGFLIAKRQIIFGDGCQGMADGLQCMFLILVYSIILVIVLAKPNTLNRYYALIITVVTAILFIASSNSDVFESSVKIAMRNKRGDMLLLRKNNTFKIQMRAVEWSCYYVGAYNMNGDTLTLLRDDIETETDGAFSKAYKFDKLKNSFIPLNKDKQLMENDSTRFLSPMLFSMP